MKKNSKYRECNKHHTAICNIVREHTIYSSTIKDSRIPALSSVVAHLRAFLKVILNVTYIQLQRLLTLQLRYPFWR